MNPIFSVNATGTGPLAYQWRKNGVAITGATSSGYTTPPVVAADHGAVFSVVVMNAHGSVASSDASLIVLAAPIIGTQPQNASVAIGQSATFSVAVTGTEPMAYQWVKNGMSISGATARSYTTPPVTELDQGGTFWVAISNDIGGVISGKATLTVLLPVVEIQPAALGCFPGDVFVFSSKVTNATDGRVAWSSSAGTIDASGRFTAPGTPGQAIITATSLEAPSQKATAVVTVRGTDFDGNAASNPKLLGLAHAMGSLAPEDLAKYDFNGDGRIDDADLAKLFQKMGW